MVKFICLRCGDCCINLIKEWAKGIYLGLGILPDEIKYFPKEMIVPQRGSGSSPYSKKFKIHMFQLNADVCPHLRKNHNNATCGIYENHPLSCRVYPFNPSGSEAPFDLIAEEDCRAIQKMIKDGLEMSIIKDSNEMISVSQLYNKIKDERDKLPTWFFDLKSQKWIEFNDNLLL